MILLDFNGTILSSLSAQLAQNKSLQIEEDLVRHFILNTLRSYKQKFETKYGRIVICNDGRNYWRKTVFPNYKSTRKKTREDSGLDWNKIFQFANKIRDEIKTNLPYQNLYIDQAEADDIIAIITKHYHSREKILIISSDKDLTQLQKYSYVEQYSPILKKMYKVEDPFVSLNLHILMGDSGDAVPNFLSPDDTFVNGIRSKSLSKKSLELWSKLNPEDFCTPKMLVGYHRNKELIDFDYIPKSIEMEILNQFRQPYFDSNSQIFPYFVKNKLTNLLQSINQFKVEKSKGALECHF